MSSARWLDQFSVLLLDMNGTFMFGHDRLGPGEDYFATYASLGGGSLTREQVQRTLQATCDELLRVYEQPERFERFPALLDALRDYGSAPEKELSTLERVFALHEIGQVPPRHAAFLARVAKTHSLGVVSNLCAKPEPWRELLRREGLLSLFTTTVFSSEGTSIKPARSLFEHALAAFPADSRVLFAGDSLERDVIPAKALGMSTVWIAAPGSQHESADRTVPSLLELELELESQCPAQCD